MLQSRSLYSVLAVGGDCSEATTAPEVEHFSKLMLSRAKPSSPPGSVDITYHGVPGAHLESWATRDLARCQDQSPSEPTVEGH